MQQKKNRTDSRHVPHGRIATWLMLIGWLALSAPSASACGDITPDPATTPPVIVVTFAS